MQDRRIEELSLLLSQCRQFRDGKALFQREATELSYSNSLNTHYYSAVNNGARHSVNVNYLITTEDFIRKGV